MTGDPAYEYVWPDDLPDQCPPAAATPATGVTYRIVKHDPPSPSDFMRPRDLPRKAVIPHDEMCAYSALSTFADLSDVKLGIRLIPGFSKRKIAVGVLSEETGVTLGSPSVVNRVVPPTILKSHRDWWVCLGITPEQLFTVTTA